MWFWGPSLVVPSSAGGAVELTLEIAEDTDNYSDALALQFNYFLALSEDSDNYADAISQILTSYLLLTDDSDNYLDAVGLALEEEVLLELTLEIAENSDNYLDALTKSLLVVLTKAIAENSNNYSDAFARRLGLHREITEDSNNYADAITVFINSLIIGDSVNNYLDALATFFSDALVITDSLTPISDHLALSFVRFLALSDTNAANFLDAINSVSAGFSTQGLPDDIAENLDDSLGMIFGIELRLGDEIIISDSDSLVSGSVLNLADNINNFQDAASTPVLNELTLLITEDTDNYFDELFAGFARLNPTQRSSSADYIRRYLNDLQEV